MSSEKHSTNILVVDDDALVRNLALEVLRQLGYEKLESAANGVEALAKLEDASLPFDLIICDLNMPEMDGVEFMHCAAQKAYKGDLILLSGEDKRILKMARDIATAQDLNILGNITKPFTAQDFAELLTRSAASNTPTNDIDHRHPISEAELLTGMAEDGAQLILFYQPIVHIHSGEVTGVESIPMWQHPTRGLLDAEAFIVVAEQNGHSFELSRQIYAKAVQQTAQWLDSDMFLQNFLSLPMAMLSDVEFSKQILSETERLGVKRTHMNLVLRESQITDQMEDSFAPLMPLHFKKIGIAIGDFGSGTSTLQQINSFPFALLQIQRNLISTEGNGNEIISIIRDDGDFHSRLDSEVALKGIDSRADWDLAEIMGIDYAQGIFCSKALSNVALLEFIQSWSPPPRKVREQCVPSPGSFSTAV